MRCSNPRSKPMTASRWSESLRKFRTLFRNPKRLRRDSMRGRNSKGCSLGILIRAENYCPKHPFSLLMVLEKKTTPQSTTVRMRTVQVPDRANISLVAVWVSSWDKKQTIKSFKKWHSTPVPPAYRRSLRNRRLSVLKIRLKMPRIPND